MPGPPRTGATIVKLGLLFSLLTGCSSKPPAATGIAFTLYTILDSAGAQYAILKVTDFDNQSGFLNMGTKSYRIFLQLKSKGAPSLDKAKATLKAVAHRYDQVQNKNAADEAIGGAKTDRELVEMCGHPWEWR